MHRYVVNIGRFSRRWWSPCIVGSVLAKFRGFIWNAVVVDVRRSCLVIFPFVSNWNYKLLRIVEAFARTTIELSYGDYRLGRRVLQFNEFPLKSSVVNRRGILERNHRSVAMTNFWPLDQSFSLVWFISGMGSVRSHRCCPRLHKLHRLGMKRVVSNRYSSVYICMYTYTVGVLWVATKWKREWSSSWCTHDVFCDSKHG